ncbi:MAG: 4-(cytidine 5'-diphospho)-2-C-methyl-D-erythritol kinase [Phycisphaerae bacterium]|nr:4-(cytidine 5'-diphospho)-2-C-methyl-D-erythritol kinase [Phycisphaerae bacterium]
MIPPTTEEMMMRHSPAGLDGPLHLRAPAKINLTLAVLGKRPDGFHEIESLVTPIELYDELTLKATTTPEIRLECGTPGVPSDSRNLVRQAADRLLAYAGTRLGAEIRLTKRVPVGAGLGGGSSDAASALMGLNQLWNLGLDAAALADVAAKVGSDVPLFLQPGATIIRGRGERVTPTRLGRPRWVVLITPPFGMNTGAVYAAWRPDQAPPCTADEVAKASQAGEPIDGLLFNMLEPPAMAVEPRLAALHRRMVELGARCARMSGSGSSLFALFDERGAAESFAESAAMRLDARIHVVQTVDCEHL